MTWCAHGGISKIFFLDHFSPSFLGQKYYFCHIFNFDGADQSWVCHILGVKNVTQNAKIDTKRENNAQKGHVLQMAGNHKLHLGQCWRVHVRAAV